VSCSTVVSVIIHKDAHGGYQYFFSALMLLAQPHNGHWVSKNPTPAKRSLLGNSTRWYKASPSSASS